MRRQQGVRISLGLASRLEAEVYGVVGVVVVVVVRRVEEWV